MKRGSMKVFLDSSSPPSPRHCSPTTCVLTLSHCTKIRVPKPWPTDQWAASLLPSSCYRLSSPSRASGWGRDLMIRAHTLATHHPAALEELQWPQHLLHRVAHITRLLLITAILLLLLLLHQEATHRTISHHPAVASMGRHLLTQYCRIFRSTSKSPFTDPQQRQHFFKRRLSWLWWLLLLFCFWLCKPYPS